MSLKCNIQKFTIHCRRWREITTRRTYVASAIAATILIFAVGVTNSFAAGPAPKGQAQITPDQVANNVASFLSVDPKTVQVDQLEIENGQSIYSASVEKNNQQFEVKVNSETGKIISAQEDLPDGNDDAVDGDGETNDDSTGSTDNGDGDGETNDDSSQSDNN